MNLQAELDAERKKVADLTAAADSNKILLDKANAEIAGIPARIAAAVTAAETPLKASIEAAEKAKVKADADLVEANKQLAEARLAVTEFEKRVAAKALEITASQGLPPDAKPTGQTKTDPAAGLTGFQKVIALTNAELGKISK
jgi:chromosome segregation ATPase